MKKTNVFIFGGPVRPTHVKNIFWGRFRSWGGGWGPPIFIVGGRRREGCLGFGPARPTFYTIPLGARCVGAAGRFKTACHRR